MVAVRIIVGSHHNTVRELATSQCCLRLLTFNGGVEFHKNLGGVGKQKMWL